MVVPLEDKNGPVVLVLGHPDIDTGRLVQCMPNLHFCIDVIDRRYCSPDVNANDAGLCRQDALEFIRDDADIKVVQWQANNKVY